MKNLVLFLVSLLAATVAITLPLSITVEGCGGNRTTPKTRTEVHVSGTQWGGVPCAFNVWAFSDNNGYSYLGSIDACY